MTRLLWAADASAFVCMFLRSILHVLRCTPLEYPCPLSLCATASFAHQVHQLEMWLRHHFTSFLPVDTTSFQLLPCSGRNH
uniref:Secreted protein n=1 Tax=Caenorhabditis japonica TaxID=281687 RepID=A0A8R1I3S3_CAEJA